MATKSIVKRIKLSKSGKVRRRAMTLGHSRGNKTHTQMQRKARYRGLGGVEHGYLERTLS